MTSFLELVAGVLMRPAGTFAQVRDRAQALLGPALGVLALVAALDALGAAAGGALALRAGAGFLGRVLLLLLGAAALGLVAEFLGGRGRTSALFALLGLSTAPRLALLPLMVLSRWWAPLGSVAGALALAWGLVLTVLAVRSAYELSTGQSVVALVAVAGLALLVPLLGLLSLVALVVSDPEVLGQLQRLR